MSYNFERVGLLLHVADLIRQWPNLNGIQDRVMDELQEISIGCKKEMDEKRAAAKAKAEEEAAAYAEQKRLEAEQEVSAQKQTDLPPTSGETTVERRV